MTIVSTFKLIRLGCARRLTLGQIEGDQAEVAFLNYYKAG